MSTATQPIAAAQPGRGLNVTLWVLQVLLGAFLAFAGINKIFGLQAEVVENFTKIGLGTWFRYLTGFLELAGGIGLLIPPLTALAALGLAGVMVGAALTHIFVLPPAYFAILPLVLIGLFLFVARMRWPASKAFLRRLTG